MPSILEKVAEKLPRISFRPATMRQLFVLRLAQKVGEPAAIEHYVELARRYNDETLLLAYRHTLNHGHPPRDLARGFHEELVRTREQEPARDRSHDDLDEIGRFLAIKIERRSIAVAVFVGTTLDYHDIRHLRAEPDKADASAVGFLNWVIGEYGITSVGLERMTNGNEIRRAGLNSAVLETLRKNSIPVWELDKPDLLAAYGYPSVRTRADLRQVAHAILWSLFNTPTPSAQELDAAALGLYIQIERQFLK